MTKSGSRATRSSGRALWLLAVIGILSLAAASCGSEGESGSSASPGPTPPAEPAAEPAPEPPEPQGPITVYSGRSEDLIGPLVERFEAVTGIAVEVRYGSSADLALLIETEGDASPADVFISQSPGAMGYLATQGRLAVLAASVLDAVAERFRAGAGTWVGLSGRQRVLVYNPDLTDEADLPDSVLDLTGPRYEGRVGVAPANSSFQDFITEMRFRSGDEATLAWLEGMAANGSPNYAKNSAIVDAVLRGEVDMGLVNHYYLLQFLAEDPQAPGVNHYFDPDDVGALLIVTAGAVLDTAEQPGAAQEFLEFMLSREAQEFYASEAREYPLAAGVQPPAELEPLGAGDATGTIDFDKLGGGLSRTQELIRQSGIMR